ncbi:MULTISPECIES: GntR family transcriptional regulator [Actinomadura]|uniref:GntR family transcriptional regulator n=1 Tax=Actinomadura livida TaxID=79909 RepID=A0A7W7IAT6_9ACTN|nr:MULTISPECIES: GntR family transcriptional regulator [Actinomadura]MBB4773594.1 DNA-binding GntR family transcriptional regulator [Actinomadura catellatispora]TDB95783.1 GntR family transcriptional regulator [Actinomadura sp. 7K534]GGU09386.1 GntR family transcriptional regulator [Actinomadura livida]
MVEYRSKTSLAVDAMREMIIDGKVQAGERFDVRRIASELGMSITPVREALRILEAEGLVLYNEHRSISAMELTTEDAKELYTLRSFLESMATEIAAENLTDADLKEIEAAQQEMVEAAQSGDPTRASAANRKWHFAIYRSGRTKFVEPFIIRLWNQFAWSTIWRVPGQLERSVAEHQEITAALVARDGARAARLMREHIAAGRRAVVDRPESAEETK